MPRKKTVQPQPVEVHELQDLTVEVYPDNKCPIGRGLPNKYQSVDRETRAIQRLGDLHFSKKSADHRLLDEFLANPSELARWLEQTEPKGQSRAFWRSAKRAVDMFKALTPRMKKRGQP